MIRTIRMRMLAMLVAGLAAALVAAVVPAGSARGEDIIFTVFNTDDTGQGSLRFAILNANLNAGPDTIRFNIPGDGVKTISPTSPLPDITDPVTIDGYTQPGSSPNTLNVGNDAELLIELDGQNAGFVDGLEIQASDSVIKGLVVNHFQRRGIVVGGSGSGATNNRIEGNFIGTDPAGTDDLGNGSGVVVAGAENFVGGDTPAARNLVSGNGFGVVLGGSGATNNIVSGNYVGSDRNGTTALGNAGTGVLVNNAPGNTVGGATAGEGNLVSGNGFGVGILNAGATDNQVLGNLIGTDASGQADLGNAASGVVVELASDNAVGGTEAGARNVISGNDGAGVVLVRAARNNEVLGNLIGTARDGSSPVGNALSGIFIGFAGADGNTVGGSGPGSSNTIAFNGGDGASVVDDATGNTILSNSIFANEDLGIDLADDGPTANDPGDGDAGPNGLQNSPVLDSARSRKKATTVKGKLTTTPNRTFAVRLFSNPQGEQEGRTFLGETGVSTDADGVARFSFQIEDPVPEGQDITATATDGDGNTSEFSAPKRVV